ncbi:hypothetical protein SKAU_G00188050 [Synaphobranchus kaupii]|uniref:Uncharacterized protein n=1 Tax=Synaphobranchus kaupii TaxID=118154 RepID=A0A9Q1FD05_SYNKA|nr:hypothetical protein SKAU_G00188050 [Synaphobranchus kaupii]
MLPPRVSGKALRPVVGHGPDRQGCGLDAVSAESNVTASVSGLDILKVKQRPSSDYMVRIRTADNPDL